MCLDKVPLLAVTPIPQGSKNGVTVQLGLGILGVTDPRSPVACTACVGKRVSQTLNPILCPWQTYDSGPVFLSEGLKRDDGW